MFYQQILNQTSAKQSNKWPQNQQQKFLSFMVKKINSKEIFLKQAAEAMEFPQYFSNNWDAFDEPITNLT
jgi:hypothetical protein